MTDKGLVTMTPETLALGPLVQQALDNEEGRLTLPLGLALDDLAIQGPEDLEALCHWIRKLEADLERWEGYRKAAANRKKVCENVRKRIRSKIREHLISEDSKVMEAGPFVARVKDYGQRVGGVDLDQVPDSWLLNNALFRIEPRKRDLLKAIKAGNDIPGVKLVDDKRLEIR